MKVNKFIRKVDKICCDSLCEKCILSNACKYSEYDIGTMLRMIVKALKNKECK